MGAFVGGYPPGFVGGGGFVGGTGFVTPNSGSTTTTLSIALTDAADPVVSGDNVVYTCQVNNTGANTATSLTVTVTLDAALAYVSSAGAGWSISQVGQVVTATLGSLAGGAAANPITVTASSAINTAVTTSTGAQVTCGNAGTQTTSQGTVVKKVSKDATSGKLYPATQTEWADFISIRALSGISVPNSIYTCQDTGTPLVDAGAAALNLALTGSGDSYRQAVTGWTALACKLTDGTTGGWRTTNAALPDPASASCARLTYLAEPAAIPSSTRPWGSLTGTTTLIQGRINVTTGFPSTLDAGSAANGTVNGAGAILPWGIRYNKTTGVTVGTTLVDKMTPTFTAGAGKSYSLGTTIAAGSFGFLYDVRWDGAAAEVSDANWKSMYQALGWAPTWT